MTGERDDGDTGSASQGAADSPSKEMYERKMLRIAPGSDATQSTGNRTYNGPLSWCALTRLNILQKLIMWLSPRHFERELRAADTFLLLLQKKGAKENEPRYPHSIVSQTV